MPVKTYQEFDQSFQTEEGWNSVDGLDDIDKMWYAYQMALEDLTGDYEAKPVEAFTENEMKAIFRLASYAAMACREDVIGAILYTGAFHFLSEDTGPNEQGLYKVARGDDDICNLARKIDKYYDPRFDPPQKREVDKGEE